MPDDAVRPVLDPLTVDPAVKRAAWDHFYQASSPEDFKSRFDALDIPKEAKHALWDLKFPQPAARPADPTAGSLNIPEFAPGQPDRPQLAYKNNNPGNLMFAGQAGATQGEKGFASWDSPAKGYAAIPDQIRLDAGRGLTLGQYLYKYAPPESNDTALYLKQASEALGVGEDAPLSSIDADKLARFQAFKESGAQFTGPLADPKDPTSALPSPAEAVQQAQTLAKQYVDSVIAKGAPTPRNPITGQGGGTPGAGGTPSQFDTRLSPAEETQFQGWKATNARDDSGEDYDLRGAFKANISRDERGHGPDTFKKPNHPTFSVESQYSTPANPGGQWSERDGKTHFTPSAANLKDRSYADLQAYFKKYEPDVVLDRPAGAPAQVGSPKILAEEPPGPRRNAGAVIVNPQLTQPAANKLPAEQPDYSDAVQAALNGDFKKAHELGARPPAAVSGIVKDLDQFLVGPFQLHSGIIQAAGSMASPEGAGLLAATGGLGAAAESGSALLRATAQSIQSGISAYFALKGTEAIAKQAPELAKAVRAGEVEGIARGLGFVSADAAMAYFATKHAEASAEAAAGAGRQAAGDLGAKYGKAQPTKAEVVPDYKTLSDEDLVKQYNRASDRGDKATREDIAHEVQQRVALGKKGLEPGQPAVNAEARAAEAETAPVAAAAEDATKVGSEAQANLQPSGAESAAKPVPLRESKDVTDIVTSPIPTADELVKHYTESGMRPAPGSTATAEEIRAGAELAMQRHGVESPERPGPAAGDSMSDIGKAAYVSGQILGGGWKELGLSVDQAASYITKYIEQTRKSWGEANFVGPQTERFIKHAKPELRAAIERLYAKEATAPAGERQIEAAQNGGGDGSEADAGAVEAGAQNPAQREDVRAGAGEADRGAAPGELRPGARGGLPEEVAAPKPGAVVELPVDSISKDPTRFQFKANVGQGGVGEELRDVTRFDPEKSGIVAVWHDPADGKTYIVNGQHRLDLAERSKTPTITARYLKAANAQEARTKGALINIAEGRGESTDAAKVFRGMGPDAETRLAREGVSIKGKIASEGLALTKLDPHLFSKVIAGDIPAARAAVIGSGLPEHTDQRALYDLVERRDKAGKRPTNDQIEEMIRLATAGPKVTETQESLFGAEDVTRSLIPEKAEISDYVRKQLAGEKRIFSSVASDQVAKQLGSAGNVIKAAENQAIAGQAERALAIYDKLSARSGPVSTALDTAASALAEGKTNGNEIKVDAYREIRAHLIKEAERLSGGGVRRAEGLGREGPLQAGAGKPGPAETKGQLDQPELLAASQSQAEAEASAKRKLEADQLTAQIKSGGQVKPLQKPEPAPQTNFFEETPETRSGDLFSDTKGGASLNTATLGLAKFIAADVRPALAKAAKSVLEVKDDILKLVAPASRGPLAKTMQGEIRAQAATLERKMDQARDALAEASKVLMRLPRDVRFEFIDRIETGRPQGDLHLQAIADVMRKMLDDARAEVQSLGTGKLQSFYENYFPHMWKDPSQAAGVFRGFFAKKPFEGPKSFLKKRTLPTFADGLAKGLEPASDNPVELVIAKLGEMQKYLMAHRTLDVMKASKMAKFVDARSGHAPIGWVKIDDPIATVYGPSIQHINEYPNAGVWKGLQDVANALGLKQQRGFMNLGQAIGRAQKGSGRVQTKHGTAEDVLAHEIGHQIDWLAGSGKRFVLEYPDPATVARLKRAYAVTRDKSASPDQRTNARRELKSLAGAIAQRKEFARQLRALADLRGGRKDYTHKREEKMAQLAEMWVGSRELFARTAPDVFREWKKFLDETPKLHALRDIEGDTEVEAISQPYDVGGLVIKGHWWAPEPAARLLNNYLAPGLRGYAAFRAYMGIGNVMLQFQLGWSAFHGTFVSLEAMTSRFALGAYQAVHGAPLKGLKSMAVGLTPATPFTTYAAGKKITAAWDRPGTQAPPYEQMANAVVEAGGRARLPGAFHSQMTSRMVEAFRAGNIVGAGLRAPFALTEQAARPIMEYLVPRMKLGVFAQMAEFEIERLGGANADPAQLREALQTAWDSVDNRMGQLVYDNLGWHRIVKDLAMGSVRTVGWNLGDIRELGGGAVDAISGAANAARGNGFNASHRLAYLLSLPVLVGLYGGIVYHLLNGQPPEELVDYYYPRDGQGNRVSMPSYIKEIQHVIHDPVGTAKGKIHPLLTLIADMLSNTDYFGRPIANADDPIVERWMARAKHIATAFEPISLQGLERNQDETLKQKVLPFIGFPRAPKYVDAGGETSGSSRLVGAGSPAARSRTRSGAASGSSRLVGR